MMFVPNQYYYPYNAFATYNAYTPINQFNAIGAETSQRTRFTKEEDELLKQLVNSQEQPNWNEVARYMKKRTARQCRERYNNYLRPNLVNGPWTKEEDDLLIELYEKYGPKWSLISQSFNSRSPVNVKNHHSSLVSQSIVKNRKNRFDKINHESAIIDNFSSTKDLKANPTNDLDVNSMKDFITNPINELTPDQIKELNTEPIVPMQNDEVQPQQLQQTQQPQQQPSVNDEYEDMFSNFQNQEELWSNNLAPTFGDDIPVF